MIQHITGRGTMGKAVFILQAWAFIFAEYYTIKLNMPIGSWVFILLMLSSIIENRIAFNDWKLMAKIAIESQEMATKALSTPQYVVEEARAEASSARQRYENKGDTPPS